MGVREKELKSDIIPGVGHYQIGEKGKQKFGIIGKETRKDMSGAGLSPGPQQYEYETASELSE